MLSQCSRGVGELKHQGRPIQFWVWQISVSDKKQGYKLSYLIEMSAFLHENANTMVYDEAFLFFQLFLIKFGPFWFLDFLFSSPILLNFMAIYSPTPFTVRRQGRPWTPRTPLVQRLWVFPHCTLSALYLLLLCQCSLSVLSLLSLSLRFLTALIIRTLLGYLPSYLYPDTFYLYISTWYKEYLSLDTRQLFKNQTVQPSPHLWTIPPQLPSLQH